MHAGFAEIDITPPVGTHMIGWLKDVVSKEVLDPLYAHVAIFKNGDERVAFIQLDTLSIRWTQVNDIRSRIEKKHGFPGKHIMVCAAHNHAGPAVVNCGMVKRDEAYVEILVQKCVEAFGSALSNMQEAEVGFNRVFEFEAAHNRRVVMRDGTVRTHGNFNDPDALYIEGPIDPEVAVLAARGTNGKILGCVVNFTCHPTHHGGAGILTAGFPGVVVEGLKERGCPVALYLNGASGNVHTADPVTGKDMSMEEAGHRIAEDAWGAFDGMEFRSDLKLGATFTTIEIPYRRVTDEEVTGTVRGAQRFVDPTIYDRTIPSVVERIKIRGAQPAEVQVIFVGEIAYAGIPAEYFVEHGLRIKRESYPRHALVVGHANGMIGYVPTKEAFDHGGYETTFAGSSRMAPEAGDMLADAAIRLIRKQ